MEAYFPRIAGIALAMWRGLFAPGSVSCSTKSPLKCIGSRNFDHLQHLSATIVSTCFDKNMIWCTIMALHGSDFIGVILIRRLPGALSRFILS